MLMCEPPVQPTPEHDICIGVHGRPIGAENGAKQSESVRW